MRLAAGSKRVGTVLRESFPVLWLRGPKEKATPQSNETPREVNPESPQS